MLSLWPSDPFWEESNGDSDDEEMQVTYSISVLRHLLLLAGSPSLHHPELWKEMNNRARKDALLAFFADRTLSQSGNSRNCGPDDIVSFL